MKKEYIITNVLCPLILDAANIEYLYEFIYGFEEESLYAVMIQ